MEITRLLPPLKIIKLKAVVVHIYNLNIGKLNSGESIVDGHLLLYSKIKTSPGYRRLCLQRRQMIRLYKLLHHALAHIYHTSEAVRHVQ